MPRPALSKSELEVAKVIWRLGNASVGEVFEALAAERDVDYSTVQTFIRRLESKGYLKARRVGRNKVYSPRVRPGQVLQETVDDLLERVFDGEMIPLMRHLIRDRQITPEQMAELRQMVHELEEQSDESSDR